MAHSKFFFFLVISFFAYSTSNAANHYVDKNSNGNNNGTSWANAWESFSDIEWNQIQPGDIIYISGGPDSTMYYERLFIGDVQGTADNPITIRNSWESGHNGRVIIDGQNKTRREGIYLGEGGSGGYRTDYITFKGIEIRDHTINIWVHNGNMVDLVFDSLLISDWTFAGIFTQGLTNNHESINGVTIQNCDLISGTENSADALQFNSSSNHIIRNNFIHMRNSQWDNDHVDGMLALWSAGFRVYNNICVLDSNAQGQPYILRARADATDEDSVIVYNNLWYQGGIWNSNEYNWTTNFYIRYNEEGYERPPMYVAHNTIITWGPTVQGVHFETGATLENNIIAAFGDGVQGPRPGGGNYQYLSQIRGNQPVDSIKQCLIWREWGDGYSPAKMLTGYFTGNGTGIEKPSWSQWVNTLGGTGINSDPLFVEDFSGRHSDQANMTGELQSGSPCRNAGNDIQDIVENKLGLDWVGIGVRNPDGLGVLPGTILRDSTPDIGAYQYVP